MIGFSLTKSALCIDHHIEPESCNMGTQYMVAYAKIVIDKEAGVVLSGVFFGGIGNTHQEAEVIAKECVNTIRGGTIIPRIVKLDKNEQMIDALYDATDKFERVAVGMKESDQIINRNRKKK